MFNFPTDVLIELPTIGRGHDFSDEEDDDDDEQVVAGESKKPLKEKKSGDKSNLIDLSKALFTQTSLLIDDALNLSTNPSSANQSLVAGDESFLNESTASVTDAANISEILGLVGDGVVPGSGGSQEIAEIFEAKRRTASGLSGASSGSRASTPSIEDLVGKRKIKKFAIEADPKLVQMFDEIKPKLAHNVNKTK